MTSKANQSQWRSYLVIKLTCLHTHVAMVTQTSKGWTAAKKICVTCYQSDTNFKGLNCSKAIWHQRQTNVLEDLTLSWSWLALTHMLPCWHKIQRDELQQGNEDLTSSWSWLAFTHMLPWWHKLQRDELQQGNEDINSSWSWLAFTHMLPWWHKLQRDELQQGNMTSKANQPPWRSYLGMKLTCLNTHVAMVTQTSKGWTAARQYIDLEDAT